MGFYLMDSTLSVKEMDPLASTVLGARNTVVNKTHKLLAFMELASQGEKQTLCK